MKKISYLLGGMSVFALPLVASAALTDGGDAGAFQNLVEALQGFIENVLVPFVIALAFLAFVWGVFKFFILGGGNEEAKAQGKSLMIYATLGFILIVAIWGIVNLIAGSVFTQGELDAGIKVTVPDIT